MRAKSSVSLKEIAKETSLSIATVSRVLRKQGEISVATRRRVLEAANRMRYRPNMLVQGIQTGRTKTVGVVVPPYDSHWTNVLYGIHDELAACNHVYINAWCQHLQEEGSYGPLLLEQLHRLIDRRVDGIILWAHLAPLYSEHVEELEVRNLPVVTIDHELPFADSVTSDEELGARLVASHLLGLGHRHIAHLAWENSYRWAHLRRECFERAVVRSGGLPCLTVEACSYEDVPAATKQLLSAHPRPTAIFACSDRVAELVYETAGSMGLRIPEDLSVVGFADLEFASYLRPGLTTVRQNGRLIGETAARLLVDRSGGEMKGAAPEHVRVKCEFVERGSTASPCGGA